MAWDTTKQTGDSLTAEEYNDIVTQVKDRVSKAVDLESSLSGGAAKVPTSAAVKTYVDAQSGGSGTDANAVHKNVAAEISTITEKTNPASSDLIIIEDSAASYGKKRVQIGNLPTGGGGASGWDTYIIYKTGSNYVVLDNDGTVLYNSTSAVTAIQTAINAETNGAKSIRFLPGIYTINAQITLKANIWFVGSAGVIFNITTAANTFITGVAHYSGTTSSLTANAEKGTQSISASSTVVAGDHIKIYDSTTVGGFTNGEILEVRANSGGVITTDRGVYDAYNTSNSAAVRKIDMIKNVRFYDIMFTGQGMDNAYQLFELYGIRYWQFIGCHFQDFGRTVIGACDALDIMVKSCIFRRVYLAGFGYCVTVSNASDHILVDGCMFLERGRHYIATGGATGTNINGGLLRHMTIVNSHFEDCDDEAINTHSASKGIVTIANNTMFRCVKGVELWNGISNIFGNTMVDCTNVVEVYGGQHNIHGNYFKNFMYLKPEADTTISNNLFETKGVIINNTTTPFDITISGNTFKEYGANLAIYFDDNNAMRKLWIMNNRIEATSTVVALTRIEGVDIIGNRIEGIVQIANCNNIKIYGNSLSASMCIRIVGASGPHYVLSNHIVGSSRGVSLEASATNASVIHVKYNTNLGPAPVHNVSNYYTNVTIV